MHDTTAAIPDRNAIAAETLTAIDGATRIAPLTARYPAFGVEEAYAAAAELRRIRMARGERQVGRKIGFTNRGIWEQFNVRAPIWGDMYDTTVLDLFQHRTLALSRFAEPLIEPEIVFGLGREIGRDTTDEALLECIDWIAHGFEIVQSIFPAWKFSGADTIAAGGLHGALLIGERHPLQSLRPETLAGTLAAFSVTLRCNGTVIDRGSGANVLGSPLAALRHLVEVLADDRHNPPLRAGEIVTTGTLTRAFPVAAGQTWTTEIEGIGLEGLSLTFT